MTIDKKYMLQNYCDTTRCCECALNDISLHWSKPVPNNDLACLDFDLSDEKDLSRAFEIVKQHIDKTESNDPVNKPSHYTDGKIEVIDYIEDKKLCFCLGNAVKYISRAGKKDPNKTVEDLRKAIWYLERKIKQLEEAK